jgi:hypothetical protein
MTALAIKALQLPRFFLVSWIIGYLTAVGKAVQISRQVQANEYIAQAMLHEYPDHTYSSLLSELNRKTLKEIYND